ncbi:hypothetical protein ACFLVS_05485 [Chloroflexota bacterium]
MGLLRTVRRYKRRLTKRFTKEITRKQLNIATDRSLIIIIRLMARQLEVPVYILCEHCLQLGIAEVDTMTQDEALRDQLCRHLVQDHLLTPVTKPEKEPVSRRVLRLKNAMSLLEILDTGKTSEQQRAILLNIMIEMQGSDNDDVSKKARSPGQPTSSPKPS